MRQLGHPRHAARLRHDLADDAGRCRGRRGARDPRRLRYGPRGRARRRRGHAAAKCVPGRSRSCGLVLGCHGSEDGRRTIRGRDAGRASCRARRWARTSPSRARDEFAETASGISSASSRSGVIARHTRPRPCVTMKLTISGVTFSAAIVKSPFVLAILVVDDDERCAPRAIAAIAASTGANGPNVAARRQPSVGRPRAGVRFVMIERLLGAVISASPARRTCR